MSELKKGDRVEIVGQEGDHGFPIGAEVVVERVYPEGFEADRNSPRWDFPPYVENEDARKVEPEAPFGVGDSVRRIGTDLPDEGMLTGRVYTVRWAVDDSLRVAGSRFLHDAGKATT